MYQKVKYLNNFSNYVMNSGGYSIIAAMFYSFQRCFTHSRDVLLIPAVLTHSSGVH